MKHLFKSASSGNPSASKTWFSLASGIILFKFLVAGATIYGHTFGAFDASGASMLLGVFGATYWGRERDSNN